MPSLEISHEHGPARRLRRTQSQSICVTMAPMAHKRPDAEPDTFTGNLVALPPESETDMGDRASIDRLLALTDEGWDIDEQMRTLQRASTDERASRIDLTPTGEPSIVSVMDLLPEKSPSPRATASEATTAARSFSGPPAMPGTGRPPPFLRRERSSRRRSGITPLPPFRAPKAAVATGPMPASDALPDLLAARVTALGRRRIASGSHARHLEMAIVCRDGGRRRRTLTLLHAGCAQVDPQCAPAHAVLDATTRGIDPGDAQASRRRDQRRHRAAGKRSCSRLKGAIARASNGDPDATRGGSKRSRTRNGTLLRWELRDRALRADNAVRGERTTPEQTADALRVLSRTHGGCVQAPTRSAAWLTSRRPI